MTSSRFNAASRALTPQSQRFSLIQFIVIGAFLALSSRLIYVQGFLGTWLRNKAERQVPMAKEVDTTRYRILDRNGVVLSETVQADSCYVDPVMLKDKHETAVFLAGVLGLSSSEIYKDIKSARGSFLWIKRAISPQAAAAIKERKILGVALRKEWRRHYPLGPLASHLCGFVGTEGHGLSGIEHQYEQTLSVPNSNDSTGNVIHGDVQLTLDSKIQQISEQELDWGIAQTKAKRGMVVVQNPTSGEILAMASYPHLSLSPEHAPDPKELKIPPVVDVFEPGSTFKIVTMAAVLEEKVVSAKDRFDGEKGSWKVMDITIHDHEPKGSMSLQDIITYSSNIGTAKLSERLGAQRLYQYCRLFGFGVYPGSGLSGEGKGLLRVLSKWSGVSPYVVSFGQEISVTAIQIVNAYSAIANGGELMEPRLVKSILDLEGKVLWKNNFSPVRRVVSKETANRVTDILVNAVTVGTGQRAQTLFNPNQRVAGKTGTAQKIDPATRKYHPTKTLVSFCGFFPADKPMYTIFVMLDEPEGRRWGGTDAAPVFRRIAEQIAPVPEANVQ